MSPLSRLISELATVLGQRLRQVNDRRKVIAFVLFMPVAGFLLGTVVGLALISTTSLSISQWWIGGVVGAAAFVVVTLQAVIDAQLYEPKPDITSRVSDLADRLRSALAEAADATKELDSELSGRSEALRQLELRHAEYQGFETLTREQLEVAARAYAETAPRERRSFWVNVAFTLGVAAVSTTIGVIVTLATAK